MSERVVGVIGATSLVGDFLLPLLAQSGVGVIAYSRGATARRDPGVEWRMLDQQTGVDARIDDGRKIGDWIVVAPVWVIPEHFALLAASGARRIVALSSTSVFVKGDSSDPGEQRVAARLAAGEEALRAWAESRGVQWIILRPTLIYGHGKDQNIAAAARFVRRFGFFPLVGAARGQRQPLHAADVANACCLALSARSLANCAYDISGNETISFRDMMTAVFSAMGRKPRFMTLPLWLVQLAIVFLRMLPGFRHVTVAMAERMNRDLVFDHSAASRDFGFAPRPFRLSAQDLPS